jgi:hypothetical protein
MEKIYKKMESQKASKSTIGMTMTTQGRFVAPLTLRLQRILNTKMNIQDKPDENGVVLRKKCGKKCYKIYYVENENKI